VVGNGFTDVGFVTTKAVQRYVRGNENTTRDIAVMKRDHKWQKGQRSNI
jgi:hypothetical protein